MNVLNLTRSEQIRQVPSRALILGIAGLVITGLWLFIDRAQFFQAYLAAYIFWSGISLGCVLMLMAHNMSGGYWGFTMRRFLEAGASALPLIAVLFLPIALGLHDLYPWADSSAVAASAVMSHRQAFLNPPFFLLRAAAYLIIWIVFGLAATRTRRAGLNALGLILYVLTITLASVDWVMSIEDQWYSTIYGVLYLTGDVIGAMAFLIGALYVLRRIAPLADEVKPRLTGDLGNLLLGFIMAWAYVAFMQLLVIWSGNIVEEIRWYINRIQNGWQILALGVAGLGFVLPFVMLLFARYKQHIHKLVLVAGIVLLSRLVDSFWLVLPAFPDAGLSLLLPGLLAVIGIGGLWLAVFARYLDRNGLMSSEVEAAGTEVQQHAG